MIKKYFKSYLYLLSIILILTIILSLINYIFLFNSNILKILIPIIAMIISSIILGKETKEKAYIEGIKFSSIYLIIITIIKLIINSPFNYKTIIIYIFLIFTSIIGTMIGINLKRK